MIVTKKPMGGDEGDYYNILLHDWHQEYTGGWDKAPLKYFAEIIWNDFTMIDLLEGIYGNEEAEAKKEEMKRLMLGPRYDDFADALGTIWYLQGVRDCMDRLFDDLYKALDVVPSGDDDVFDYWPNSMDMLFELGKDLGREEEVTELADRVFENMEIELKGGFSLAEEWNIIERWRKNEG